MDEGLIYALLIGFLVVAGALALSGQMGLGLAPRDGGEYTPPAPAIPVITSSSISVNGGGDAVDGATVTANRTVTGYPSPEITYQHRFNAVDITDEEAQTMLLDEAGMGLTDGGILSCLITATNTEGSDTDEPTIAFVVPEAPADTTPDAFDLGGPVTGEPDEILYSNELTLAGVTAATAIPATLTGGHGGCCRLERFNGSTWDNLGASTDLFLGDLWRVRTRAHTTTDTFVLTATVGGVSDTLTVNTVVEAAAIPTPTLVKTSAAGAPIKFNITGLIPDDVVGLDWYIEVGGGTSPTPDFTDGPGAEVALRTERRQIVYGDFTGDLAFTALESLPNGFACVRLSIKADDGTSGGLSNVLSETVSLLDPSILESVNGPGKNQFLTRVSDLVAQGQVNNIGVPLGIRVNQSRAGKFFFSASPSASTSNRYGMGLCTGDFNFNTTVVPETGNSEIVWWGNDGFLRYNGGYSAQYTTSWANGVVRCMAFDTVAGKLWVGTVTLDSITWHNGDPAAGTGGFTIPAEALYAALILTPRDPTQTTLALDLTTATYLPSGFTVFT